MHRGFGQTDSFLHMSSLVHWQSLSKQSDLYLNNQLLHITNVVVSALKAQGRFKGGGAWGSKNSGPLCAPQ